MENGDNVRSTRHRFPGVIDADFVDPDFVHSDFVEPDLIGACAATRAREGKRQRQRVVNALRCAGAGGRHRARRNTAQGG